jgi:hypothetical protein
VQDKADVAVLVMTVVVVIAVAVQAATVLSLLPAVAVQFMPIQ